MNKEFQRYTISDLIIELVDGKKIDKRVVNNEIISRLKYCGFDINTINYVIAYEKAIVSKRASVNNILLIDNYF